MSKGKTLGHVRIWLVGIAGLLGSATALAQSHDLLFRNNLENVTDAPATDAEAARFLTQATFGPTLAEIARLRAIGYDQWLEQQFSLSPSLTRPWLNQLTVNGGVNFTLSSSHRVDRWHVNAVFGPDQLRQRMAFALSEIMVTSDSNGLDTLMMAEYADLLARDAFGNYRTLLGEVTYSPTMAQWLTYVRNRAAYTTGNPPTTISPDQNYAREVMQLFSFGLIKRNLDYSPLLVNGLTQATYDNTIIATMARVFTGLSYDRYSYVTVPPDVNVIPSFGDNDYVDYMRPMLCFPMQANNTNYLATGRTYHDNATKTIFDGRVLPAVANTLQGCNADINAALDEISAHPSVAPFISRQLIQRFVSSNPSPQYISRVANVFNNNGSGVYGDLSAVLKTILMDPEARGAPTTNSGKLREPLLRISALWRGLDVVQGAPETAAGSVGNISMGLGFNSSFNQRPYNSPTVFNFFEPDYQNPGALQLANLYSPEFQILNESSITGMNDTIQSLIANWYVGSTSCTGSASNLSRPCIPFAPYVAMLQTANATTYAQLVDELNLRTMYGSMSANMRTVLIAMLTGQTAPTTDATRITRIQQVLRVIIASPEFAVQR